MSVMYAFCLLVDIYMIQFPHAKILLALHLMTDSNLRYNSSCDENFMSCYGRYVDLTIIQSNFGWVAESW